MVLFPFTLVRGASYHFLRAKGQALMWQADVAEGLVRGAELVAPAAVATAERLTTNLLEQVAQKVGVRRVLDFCGARFGESLADGKLVYEETKIPFFGQAGEVTLPQIPKLKGEFKLSPSRFDGMETSFSSFMQKLKVANATGKPYRRERP